MYPFLSLDALSSYCMMKCNYLLVLDLLVPTLHFFLPFPIPTADTATAATATDYLFA